MGTSTAMAPASSSATRCMSTQGDRFSRQKPDPYYESVPNPYHADYDPMNPIYKREAAPQKGLYPGTAARYNQRRLAYPLMRLEDRAAEEHQEKLIRLDNTFINSDDEPEFRENELGFLTDVGVPTASEDSEMDPGAPLTPLGQRVWNLVQRRRRILTAQGKKRQQEYYDLYYMPYTGKSTQKQQPLSLGEKALADKKLNRRHTNPLARRHVHNPILYEGLSPRAPGFFDESSFADFSFEQLLTPLYETGRMTIPKSHDLSMRLLDRFPKGKWEMEMEKYAWQTPLFLNLFKQRLAKQQDVIDVSPRGVVVHTPSTSYRFRRRSVVMDHLRKLEMDLARGGLNPSLEHEVDYSSPEWASFLHEYRDQIDAQLKHLKSQGLTGKVAYRRVLRRTLKQARGSLSTYGRKLLKQELMQTATPRPYKNSTANNAISERKRLRELKFAWRYPHMVPPAKQYDVAVDMHKMYLKENPKEVKPILSVGYIQKGNWANTLHHYQTFLSPLFDPTFRTFMKDFLYMRQNKLNRTFRMKRCEQRRIIHGHHWYKKMTSDVNYLVRLVMWKGHRDGWDTGNV